MAMMRSDVRPMVIQAVNALFDANPAHAFVTGIGGRFAFEDALQGWALPYSVFFVIDDTGKDTFTERLDNVLVQISVWAPTAIAALKLASSAYDLFEMQEMAAPGVVNFRLHRDTPVPLMNESDGTTSLYQAGICLTGLVQTI